MVQPWFPAADPPGAPAAARGRRARTAALGMGVGRWYPPVRVRGRRPQIVGAAPAAAVLARWCAHCRGGARGGGGTWRLVLWAPPRGGGCPRVAGGGGHAGRLRPLWAVSRPGEGPGSRGAATAEAPPHRLLPPTTMAPPSTRSRRRGRDARDDAVATPPAADVDARRWALVTDDAVGVARDDPALLAWLACGFASPAAGAHAAAPAPEV